MTGGTQAPAPVIAAVAHGELLTLAPFGTADGVVARAVSRLVTIATGLDPHGLGVPEVGWMRRAADYREAAHGFADGTPEGMTKWLVLSCRAMRDRRAGGVVDRRIAHAIGCREPRPSDSARWSRTHKSGRRTELRRLAAR